MTNGTRILIAILIIAAITVGVLVNINKTETQETKSNSEISDMLEYINQTQKNETENIVEENKVVENKEQDEVENQENANQENGNQENTIGKEEQESNQQNTQIDNIEKAIELAKEGWAISVDSYDFQAKLKNEGIYEVTVISNDSNRTTVAIYTVNVKDGTVTE